MFRRFVLTAAVLGSLALSLNCANATQRSTGNGHIAHTRRAPVIMHRTFPPYTGIHVYEGKPKSK